MRYIALTEAKAGMQLATSLYDSNGRTLVGSHILLTDQLHRKTDRIRLCGYLHRG